MTVDGWMARIRRSQTAATVGSRSSTESVVEKIKRRGADTQRGGIVSFLRSLRLLVCPHGTVDFSPSVESAFSRRNRPIAAGLQLNRAEGLEWTRGCMVTQI